MSFTHSQTLPAISYNPYPLGAYLPTGSEPMNLHFTPSSNLASFGAPLGASLGQNGAISPHGYACPSKPPRAAFSHSASVGRRAPRQVQNAVASSQLTFATGSWARCGSAYSSPDGALPAF